MNRQSTTSRPVNHSYLLISLIVYLGLSFFYLLAVPAGESPDEPGHLQCIEQVSLLGRLPQIDPPPEGPEWWSRGRIISGRMCYHMPLYYLIAGGLQRVVATAVSEPIDYEFPPSNENFGPSPVMFNHPAKVSFWSLGMPTHLLALRSFSILLGGVTVWASYAAAHRFLPGQPLVALLAALLTAVWPQYVYLSRSLNNDGLATALAATILVVLLDVQQPRRFVWAALLAVLAIFTKLSVAFTAVAVLLVWGMEFWRSPAQRRQYVGYLAICLGLYAAGFLLLFLTATLWQHFTQGSSSFASFSEAVGEWSYWQEVLRLTASSGWVRFGWMGVAAPQGHAYAWWAVLLGTAVLGISSALHTFEQPAIRWQLTIMLVWLLLIGLSFLQINLNRLQPQFRFALAAIPVLTTLSAAGWVHGLRRNEYIVKIGVVSIVVSLLVYNGWVIDSIIKTAYHYW
jgi:hypothetical protein